MVRPIVVQATPPEPGNPYYTLLGDALRDDGWDFRYTTSLDEMRGLCRDYADRGVVVHFHQLEPYYRSPDLGTMHARLAELCEAFAGIRLHGGALVHTMHNERPHDALHLDLDAIAVGAVGQLGSAVVVLGESLRRHAEEITVPERVTVVRHPHFVSAYGPIQDQREARRRLAIPKGDTVFLSVGALKPYKGHELMLEGFRRASLRRARMMIAGGKPPPGYAEALEDRVSALGRRRARLTAVPVPDDLMASWLSAADVAVFGFSSLFMSGSVILALSYGLPVVAPDVGCLDEYVVHGRNGFLYDVGDADSMAHAMRQAAQAMPTREEVVASVEHLAPQRIGRDLAELYRHAFERRWEA